MTDLGSRHARRLLTAWVVAAALMTPFSGYAATFIVASGDIAALRSAVVQANTNAGSDTINVSGFFPFDAAFQGGATVAVADITGNGTLTIIGTGATPATLRGQANGIRLFNVTGSGDLVLQNLEMDNFSVTGNGGIISQNGGKLTLRNSIVSNGRASGDGGGVFVNDGNFFAFDATFRGGVAVASGGALSIGGNDTIVIERSTFSGNGAARGGGIDFFGSGTLTVSNSVFDQNTATVFGCDFNQESSPNAPEGLFIGNTFIGSNCTNVRIEQPSGRLQITGSTISHNTVGHGIDSTGGVVLGSSIIVAANQLGGGSAQIKQGCRDFGSSAISSAGGNLSSDATCFLTQPTDQQNVDPRLGVPDSKGSIPLLAGSPAIDRGGSALRTVGGRPTLPCGYKDSRGLGRPQDGNNDGTHACDSGSYEVQGGADITGSYSAAYFDTSRGGEGTLMEILDGGIAFVAKFTYRPNGGTAWFIGVGNVAGNSVVLDDFLITTGGVFGAGFDPASVNRIRVGGASYNFSTCDSSARPGRLAFAAEPGNGYEDLLVNASRLTSIVPCSGAPSANAGRSGSFFAANRSGEGILVQFLPDGRVFLVWYTYDPQGNQFWIVSGDVTVNGNVVTAQMLYPATTTRFGSQFNSSQIGLQPWGTVTLTYSGCDNLTYAYTSSVAGFGNGQYNYQRLTRLRGTTCTP